MISPITSLLSISNSPYSCFPVIHLFSLSIQKQSGVVRHFRSLLNNLFFLLLYRLFIESQDKGELGKVGSNGADISEVDLHAFNFVL